MRKILNIINNIQKKPIKQHGAVLMVMLVILVVGASALLLSSLNSTAIRVERDQNTSEALVQAKNALIGYAITYGDNNTNQLFGYLPLPDLGDSRTLLSKEGDAAGSFTGNTKNLTVIGRFPWRKLGLPPLRDGQGECLWYAVSGSFQNINKADVLNWDSLGHFESYSAATRIASQAFPWYCHAVFGLAGRRTRQPPFVQCRH